MYHFEGNARPFECRPIYTVGMDILTPILIGLALALLTPVCTSKLAGYLNNQKRLRVFNRITGNAYFKVDAVFSKVELQGHPLPLMDYCRVYSIDVGEVVLQSLVTGDLLPITGVELEQLWPTVCLRALGNESQFIKDCRNRHQW